MLRAAANFDLLRDVWGSPPAAFPVALLLAAMFVTLPALGSTAAVVLLLPVVVVLLAVFVVLLAVLVAFPAAALPFRPLLFAFPPPPFRRGIKIGTLAPEACKRRKGRRTTSEESKVENFMTLKNKLEFDLSEV